MPVERAGSESARSDGFNGVRTYAGYVFLSVQDR
jgi:hypothetical protein